MLVRRLDNPLWDASQNDCGIFLATIAPIYYTISTNDLKCVEKIVDTDYNVFLRRKLCPKDDVFCCSNFIIRGPELWNILPVDPPVRAL